jgi:hypothetical protein
LKFPCAMAIGLGLASIYLLPVIFERGFVHIEFIKTLDYKDSFLFLKKNLIKREFYPIVHGIAILETAFLIFSFLLIKKNLIKVNTIFFVILLLISMFLTLPLSSLIWRYMPEFPNLQFPWRWLTLSGLSFSILAGNLFSNFNGEVKKSVGVFCSVLLIISLYIILQVSFFRGEVIYYWKEHSNMFSPFEYRPVWLNDAERMLIPTKKGTIIKGDGSLYITKWKSNQHILSTTGNTPLTVKLSTFFYPGWNASIDGIKAQIMIEKGSGAMLIDIPRGEHTIVLIFTDTPIRYYSKLISLGSCLIIFLLALFSLRPNGILSFDRIIT